METKTLKELKEENAAAEAAVKANEPAIVKEPIKDDYVEVDKSGVAVEEKVKQAEEGGETKPTIEPWMQTEETEASEDDQPSGFVPNHEAAKRRKQAKALKGELKEKDSENETLKARIAELENGSVAPKVKPELSPRPTREQFEYDDDAYDKAVDDWNDEKIELKLNSRFDTNQQNSNREQQQQAALKLQTKNLDDHYDRANKLVSDGLITAESFKKADSLVRQSVESIFPERGEAITNALISTLNSLGDGSEKVMYQLGVNPAKMQEFQNLLVTDPSGMAASAFLGRLQANITTPKKRSSQAPAPGSEVEGEGGKGGKAGTMQKEYEKSDDLQTRIDLKRAAKAKGIDVSNW